MSLRPALRCKAKSNRTGRQCAAFAVHGTTVCKAHGGASPQVKAAAARRVQEAEAMRQAESFLASEGTPALGNPLEAMQLLAQEVIALKDYFARRVAVLEEMRYRGATGEQLRAEVALYERGLDRSLRALDVLAKSNIDERLTRIEQAKIEITGNAVVRGLEATPGLSPELRQSAIRRIASELQAVGEPAGVVGRQAIERQIEALLTQLGTDSEVMRAEPLVQPAPKVIEAAPAAPVEAEPPAPELEVDAQDDPGHLSVKQVSTVVDTSAPAPPQPANVTLIRPAPPRCYCPACMKGGGPTPEGTASGMKPWPKPPDVA